MASKRRQFLSNLKDPGIMEDKYTEIKIDGISNTITSKEKTKEAFWVNMNKTIQEFVNRQQLLDRINS